MTSKNHANMGKQAEKFDKAVIKRLFSYMSNYKAQIILVFICIVLSAIATVSSSIFLKTLIDKYITPLIGSPNPIFSGLIRYVMFIAVVYLIGTLSTLIYTRVMVYVSQGVLKSIRDEMFIHMQKLPVKYFDTNTHGDVMSHYTNDIDTLRQLISQSLPQAISSIITVISVAIAMIFTSIPMTLFTLVLMAGILYTGKTIAGKSGKFFVSQQKSLGEINGYIEEMINGQKVIKVFCHEEKTKNIFDEKNEDLRKNASEANVFSNILMPIMSNLGTLQYILLAIFGGVLALSNISAITLGGIASFLQLSRSFIMPISQIAQQINFIVMAFAGAKRIFELLDQEEETDEGYVRLVNIIKDGENFIESEKQTGKWAWKHPHSDGSVTYTELKGHVVLENVDFGYNEDKLVLKDINIYAEPGQKVAFVGATGAGKTTITNLINRFYNINNGKIRYDGINITKINKQDLRRSLGVVLQDTHLFTGTVLDNIRYGKLEATDEECINAAKQANAHHFIELLANGYETVLSGSGDSLSQGQRQLLAIARAIVANPPVMILDEATSSIDTHTEAIVQRGMDKLMDGRTVFVIAHRLSTIQNSDVIMVLDFGKIIERGNHDSLIAEKGKYYQLYTGGFDLE